MIEHSVLPRCVWGAVGPLSRNCDNARTLIITQDPDKSNIPLRSSALGLLSLGSEKNVETYELQSSANYVSASRMTSRANHTASRDKCISHSGTEKYWSYVRGRAHIT